MATTGSGSDAGNNSGNDPAIRQKKSALRLLDHTVDGLARRQRRQHYLRCLADALFWGLGVAAVVVFCLRYFAQAHSVLVVAVLSVASAMVISAIAASRRLPDKLAIAIAADEKLQFKQRLSTAWEYRQSQPESELTSALALQAGGARLPSVSSVFPFELNMWGMLVPLAACLLVLANLVELKLPASATLMTQVDQLVVDEGARLEEFARRMRQKSEREGYARSLAESVKLQEMGAEMKSGAVNREQALQKLQRLQRSLTNQRSAALGEALQGGSKYHIDRQSPSTANNTMTDAQPSGFSNLRDKLSAGRLSPEDLEALNRSLKSLEGAEILKDDLKTALDRYSRGESTDLQRILDKLSEGEENQLDADQLDRARAAIIRSRGNLGDDSGGEPGGQEDKDAMAFGDNGEAGDDSFYAMSEFAGITANAGSGTSQGMASFEIPGEESADATAQSGETQATLKPEAQIREGESFRSETWTLPKIGVPSQAEITLDTEFETQVEAVLSRETYPLHRKEIVRQYFLNLSSGAGKKASTENPPITTEDEQ